MAIKQFAIPLNEFSTQSGDIHLKDLVNAGTSAEFKLSDIISGGAADELNLITKKNGTTKDHKFPVTVNSGTAGVVLTTQQLAAVYGDAVGGNWDYVEAKWTLGQVDTPNPSRQVEIQGGRTYNAHGWPPNS